MDEADEIFNIRPPLRASTDVNSQNISLSNSPAKSPFFILQATTNSEMQSRENEIEEIEQENYLIRESFKEIQVEKYNKSFEIMRPSNM